MADLDLMSVMPTSLAANLKSVLAVAEPLRPLIETTNFEVTRLIEIPIAPGFRWSASLRIRDFGHQGGWMGDSPDSAKHEKPIEVHGYPSLFAEEIWEGAKINDFHHVGLTCWDMDFGRENGADLPAADDADLMILRGKLEPLNQAQVSGFYSRGGAEMTPEMKTKHLESLATRWHAGTLTAERFRLLTDDGDLFDGAGRLIGIDESIRSTGQLRKIRAAFDDAGFEALFDLGVIYSGVNGSALSRAASPKLRDRLDAAMADETRSAGLNFHLAISLETFARFLAQRPEPRPFWRSHRRELGKDMIATLLKMEVERIQSGMKPDASPGAS